MRTPRASGSCCERSAASERIAASERTRHRAIRRIFARTRIELDALQQLSRCDEFDAAGSELKDAAVLCPDEARRLEFVLSDAAATARDDGVGRYVSERIPMQTFRYKQPAVRN